MTFGKVMGGGFPAAAFGGRADVMAPAGAGRPGLPGRHAVREPGRHRRRPRDAAACTDERLRPRRHAPPAELGRAGVRGADRGGRRAPRAARRQHVLRLLHRRTPVTRLRRRPAAGDLPLHRVLPRDAGAASTCRRRRSRRGSSPPPTTTPRSSGSPTPCPPPPAPPRPPPRPRRELTPMSRDHGRAPAAPRRGAQPRQGPLRPAARLPPVRARPGDGRAGRRARWPTRTSPTSCPRRWSGPRRRRAPIADGARAAGRHRRPADRGRQRLRGQDVRRRRRLAAPSGALEAPAQPVPAVLGRAVRRDRRADARRDRRARDAARGHEAVRVSHQLPIWTARGRSRPAGGCGTTRASGSARWPRSRPSPTTATSWSSVSYEEPARDLLPVPALAPQEVRRRARDVRLAPPAATRPPPARRRCASLAGRLLAGCSRRGRRAANVAGPGLRLGRRHGDQVAADQAQGAGHVRRHHARRQAARRRRPPRARSSSSTCGRPGARRASPRRRRCRRCTSRPAAKGVQFVGIDIRDQTAAAARAHERRFGVTYPSLDDPTAGARCSPSRAPCRRRAIPITLVLDRAGPGRRPGAGPGRRDARCAALVDDAVAEPSMTMSIGGTDHRRVAAARAAAGAWRPGWCRSSRRACCRSCPATCRTSPG